VAPTSDWICCAGEASVDPGPRAPQPGDRDRRRSAGGDRCTRTPTEAALHGAWVRGTRAVGPWVARRCTAVDMARGARVNKISLNPLGSGGCVRPGPLSGPYREHPRDWGGSGRLLLAPAAHRAGLIARTSRQPGACLDVIGPIAPADIATRACKKPGERAGTEPGERAMRVSGQRPRADLGRRPIGGVKNDPVTFPVGRHPSQPAENQAHARVTHALATVFSPSFPPVADRPCYPATHPLTPTTEAAQAPR
jgi:hypothetical protein